MPGSFPSNAGAGVPNVPSSVPAVRGFADGFSPVYEIATQLSGVSRDGAGVALPLCTVTLFRVDTEGSGPRFTQEQQVVSDAVTGAYRFNVAPGQAYRVTYDLAGSPAKAGLTAQTLTGA